LLSKVPPIKKGDQHLYDNNGNFPLTGSGERIARARDEERKEENKDEGN